MPPKYARKKEKVETEEEIKARRRQKKKDEKAKEEAEGKKDAFAIIKRLCPWGQEEPDTEDESEPDRPQMFPGAHPAMISVSSDTTMRKWDIKTGTCERVFVGHEGTVLAMDMNFDSWYAITASADNTLAIWDVKSLQWRGGVAGHEGAVSDMKMDWKNDRCVTSSFDHSLRTWANLLEGEYGPPPFDDSKCTRVLKDHTGPVTCMDVDWTQGKAMSGSQDYVAKLWDLETGDVVSTWGGPSVGHTAPIWGVSMSLRQQQAYTVSMDRHLLHWDMRSPEPVRAILRHESFVTAIDVNWDRQQAITCSCDRTIAHWDLTAGEVMDRLTEHSGSVWCLNVDWEGNRMVTGAGPGDNAIRLWDMTDYFAAAEIFGHDSSIWKLSVDWAFAHKMKREMEEALFNKGVDSDEEEEKKKAEEAEQQRREEAAIKIQKRARVMQARKLLQQRRLARQKELEQSDDEWVEVDEYGRPRFTD